MDIVDRHMQRHLMEKYMIEFDMMLKEELEKLIVLQDRELRHLKVHIDKLNDRIEELENGK